MHCIQILSYLYELFNNFRKYLKLDPPEKFTYDSKTDSISVEVQHVYSIYTIPLKTFRLDGDYRIKIDGKNLVTFTEGSIQGLPHGYTYFLGNGYFKVKKQCTVSVYDVIMDETKEYVLTVDEIVDIKQLVNP